MKSLSVVQEVTCQSVAKQWWIFLRNFVKVRCLAYSNELCIEKFLLSFRSTHCSIIVIPHCHIRFAVKTLYMHRCCLLCAFLVSTEWWWRGEDGVGRGWGVGWVKNSKLSCLEVSKDYHISLCCLHILSSTHVNKAGYFLVEKQLFWSLSFIY